MFLNANAFNRPIGNWDTSSVTNTRGMFYGTQMTFNQPIGNWDVSKVENMLGMFEMNKAFNQPIGIWDTSSVTDMQRMFSVSPFNQNLWGWDVSQVTVMTDMFSQADALSDCNKRQIHDSFSSTLSNPSYWSYDAWSLLECGKSPSASQRVF